jgi:hypothetical protein
MMRPKWEDLPKGLKLKPGLRIDQAMDMGIVEAVFSEDEACCDHVHPNLVLFRAVRTGEVVGCRLRMKDPLGTGSGAPVAKKVE